MVEISDFQEFMEILKDFKILNKQRKIDGMFKKTMVYGGLRYGCK